MSLPPQLEKIKLLIAQPDEYFILGLRELQSHYAEPNVKRQMALMIRTLVAFMDDHKLTKRWLSDPIEAFPADFVLRRGDLTDEGLLFYSLAEKRWMPAHDRGVSVTDTSLLVRILKEIRGANQKNNRSEKASKKLPVM